MEDGKDGRTSPDASITAETQGALQLGRRSVPGQGEHESGDDTPQLAG